MTGFTDGASAYSKAFVRGLEPDPVLQLSEWADRYRMLSGVGAAEPGKYRTDRTPYWRQVMDDLSADSPWEHVVVCKSAQIGASECGNNWVGYIIDQVPGPTMVVQPTKELAQRFSRQRVEPMLRESPQLAGKVHAPRERDSGNTVLFKEFAGGALVLSGAKSPASFRQMPIRYLMRDEIDVWEETLPGEGDPMDLAERGTRTFKGRGMKILDISTPTIDGRSKIWAKFEISTQAYYHVPCPSCGTFQRLVWKQLMWEGSTPKTPAELDALLKTVRYECEHCHKDIPEHKKHAFLNAGRWIEKNPGATIRGYHLNALYAPLGLGWSWRDLVVQWFEAQKHPERLRVFVNQVLAECYREKGEAPPWRVLYRRRESYKPGLVPEGPLLLTAGIDVQQERLEIEVVGWGRNRESWSVDFRVIQGEVTGRAPWAALEQLLADGLPHVRGMRIPIRMACIDTGGHWTQLVYWWVRNQRRDQVLGIQGRESPPVILGTPRAVDVNYQGRRIARGMQLWPVGTSVAKHELYSLLRIEPPLHPEKDGYPAGYVHFPEYDESWYKGITAEQIVPRIVRGYRKYVWELLPGRRNEPLDCRNYARAAAAALGVDRWSDELWDEVERTLGKPAAPPRKRKRKRDGAFSRWHTPKHSTTRSSPRSQRGR